MQLSPNSFSFLIALVAILVIMAGLQLLRNLHSYAGRIQLAFLLGKLEGCHPDAFQILTADAVREKWFLDVILTEHAPSHAGKCFGYALCVNGQYVLYTGDTHTLAPYISNIMASGNYGNTVLYTEAASLRSDVHLFLQDHLNELLSLCEKGVRVFLMHLDNEEAIRKIIAGTPLRIVPL